MKDVKVWLTILLVFIAGFAAGVVATRAVTRRTVEAVVRDPDRLRGLIERRLAVRLRLDPNQRREVDDILLRTQNDLKELRGQFGPPFQAIMSNTQSEISASLTPEQRERFAKFREENRQLWQPR